MISELIEDGWSLLIYPEGGRSPDGWGQPFRGGAAYLAIRCDVPVIPIHISGTGKILRKGRNLPRRSKSTVTFGYPMKPETDESARSFSTRIENEVRSLADESFNVLVLEDCCAAGSMELHNKELEIINMIYCHVMTSKELISMMGLEMN